MQRRAMVRPEPHFNLDSEDTNRFAAEESQLNDAPFPGKAFFRLLIPRKNFATRRERKLQSFEFRIGRNGKRKETLRSVGEDRIFPSLGSGNVGVRQTWLRRPMHLGTEKREPIFHALSPV